MIRVLIADDHELVRRGTRDIIQSAFGEVKLGEAGNTREAIALLMASTWDLVLLDINMPGRSGLEVLEEVKRLRPETPVLILSAYPEEEFAVRSLKLGAAGYVTKSSAADELLTAIKKVLAGGKYVTASLAERLATMIGRPSDQDPHEMLSGRELQVLRLVATGWTLKEIAAEMGLSEKTIATYRARISDKLALSTNVELTRYACQHHLVD